MILTYHGGDFVKAQSGDTIVAVNPISKSSKLKTTKFGADVALISVSDADHNGVEEVTFGTKVPFVASGPGEYETKDIFIKGFASGGERDANNTIYSVLFDGIHLCFLGALINDDLKDALEDLSDIDILFVPVGLLGAEMADKIATKLEPKLIVPLGSDADIKAFLKEAGESAPEKLEKLTIKKKDLEGKEGDIVLLSA
ncbi:MAG: MBL fold metallo-hydrolase [Patescibacteria group bacterium]